MTIFLWKYKHSGEIIIERNKKKCVTHFTSCLCHHRRSENWIAALIFAFAKSITFSAMWIFLSQFYHKDALKNVKSWHQHHIKQLLSTKIEPIKIIRFSRNSTGTNNSLIKREDIEEWFLMRRNLFGRGILNLNLNFENFLGALIGGLFFSISKIL